MRGIIRSRFDSTLLQCLPLHFVPEPSLTTSFVSCQPPVDPLDMQLTTDDNGCARMATNDNDLVSHRCRSLPLFTTLYQSLFFRLAGTPGTHGCA